MAGWTCRSCGADNVPGTRYCGYCAADSEAVPAREERRLITALFADLSGFTSLAERLDAEQLLEVIDPIVGALSEIVGRYEGQVEKYAGDAVLALFGAPVAHDDDAERALRAALDMHEELTRICERLPEDRSGLTLHVGVASGHGIGRMLGSASRMDYAVLGDSVILAQRLESSAPPGQTYVDETTCRLGRHAFEFEPVGELTLKGKSMPVPAWRLVGRESAGLIERSRGRLVGRLRELETIDTVLGDGGTLVLLGEPGVGKSRLVTAARARAELRGMRWLQGRCPSYGENLTYWPFIELLRSLEDRPSGPYVDRLLGLDADIDVEPEAYRQALHDEIQAWLSALAASRPTVLTIEDVHWADEASLALTAAVAEPGDGLPLTILLVARPEGGPRLAEVAPAASRLELGPLTAPEIEELLARQLPDVTPELIEAVHDRTGGNPYFVEELARALQEQGATPDELPPTIEGVLTARLDSLAHPAADVLRRASVIGRRVPLPLLRRVVDESDDLEAAIDVLVAGGFLDLEGAGERVVFHHALMQDAAYGRLLRRQRRELHRRVAEEAEALYGAGEESIELLARHLYLGEAGPKAVEYLVRAAERARALFANEEAVGHLERALEVGGFDPDIALALAGVHEFVGNYDEALRLYSETRERAGTVRAWRGAAATLRKLGRYDEALALLDGGPDDVELELERGWTHSVAGRFDEALATLEQAVVDAAGRTDAVAGHLLLQLARAETVGGRLGPALAHALDAGRIFEAEQDLRGLTTALRIQGNVYGAVGRFDDAAVTLQRGLATAERVGSVEEIGGCLLNLGMVELERGHLDDAIALDRRAIEQFERISHGSGRAGAYGNLSEKLLAAGELNDALRTAEQALALGGEIGHAPTVADVQRTMARILLAQGRAEEAADRAEASAAVFREMGAEAEAEAALAVAESARK
jgi:adenylate cyclase